MLQKDAEGFADFYELFPDTVKNPLCRDQTASEVLEDK
jgi:hypothetical protein